jgi:hypothetical protein
MSTKSGRFTDDSHDFFVSVAQTTIEIECYERATPAGRYTINLEMALPARSFLKS